jgi:hypothetical protein
MADYINKEEMLAEILEYRLAVLKAKEEGIDKPSLSNSLMKKFMMITDGIARRPNFNGYSFLDEMKSRANYSCIKKAHYFDPTKSDNPFGYYSRVIWREFLNVIKEEEKQSYIKAKTFYNSSATFDSLEYDKDVDVQSEGFAVPYFDVDEYEKKNGIDNSHTKKEKKLKEQRGPLSDFLEEDEIFDSFDLEDVEE